MQQHAEKVIGARMVAIHAKQRTIDGFGLLFISETMMRHRKLQRLAKTHRDAEFFFLLAEPFEFVALGNAAEATQIRREKSNRVDIRPEGDGLGVRQSRRIGRDATLL
ncbi:hypothetical protein [Terrarubrum flagellatum]|uniref:hypothetical protein n=1 Tax=Terrirubrum flagellatum TaxID=2895980 RepID=UPI003145039F